VGWALLVHAACAVTGLRRRLVCSQPICVCVVAVAHQVVGLEPALVEADVVTALITIGLLRSHEPQTQMRCIDALHNVLANSVCRQTVLSSEVIWALQKLVRYPKPQSCHVALHRIALHCVALPHLHVHPSSHVT
jgi:hypothetical protein